METTCKTDHRFTVKQVARKYNINEKKVARLIEAGILHAVDVRDEGNANHQWRISKDDLADFELRRSSRS